MPKKKIARVVLSPPQKDMRDRIRVKLGQSESETLSISFIEYTVA